MPCKKCGEPLIADPNFKLWCANCSPSHVLYSKKKTYDVIEALYIKCEKEFLTRSKPLNKRELIKIYHDRRNEPYLPFFNNYFIYSLSISILHKEYLKHSPLSKSFLLVLQRQLTGRQNLE